jgi:undecaprenyl-diphosphatase
MYPQTLWFLGTVCVLLIILSILVRLRATYAFDLKATKALQELNSPFLDKAAKWATFMGNSLTLIILAIVIFVVCAVLKQGQAAVFVVASLLALPLNVILKNIIDRERPGEKEAKIHPGPRWGFSYPSGHSMGSAAFYGFLAVIVWLHVPNMSLRAILLVPFILQPILTGLSRIYLGAHWLSDVVGGWAGGVLVVSILSVLYEV